MAIFSRYWKSPKRLTRVRFSEPSPLLCEVSDFEPICLRSAITNCQTPFFRNKILFQSFIFKKIKFSIDKLIFSATFTTVNKTNEN